MEVKRHKFCLGNPCGPCEWHIETDVRIFAWFDFLFQAVFVVPVILQLKIYLAPDPASKIDNNVTGNPPPPGECDGSRIDLAILYSFLDIINLSLGIATDILLYIGTKQKGLLFNKFCVVIFLITSTIRESLHIAGIVVHVMRCKAATYPYEFVVRFLCQYILLGIWIAIEYYLWLSKGRLFVPQRGEMVPPHSTVTGNVTEEMSTTTSIITSSTDFTVTASPSAMSPNASGPLGEIPTDDGDGSGKRRKSRRRSKKRSLNDPKMDENPLGEEKK